MRVCWRGCDLIISPCTKHQPSRAGGKRVGETHLFNFSALLLCLFTLLGHDLLFPLGFRLADLPKHLDVTIMLCKVPRGVLDVPSTITSQLRPCLMSKRDSQSGYSGCGISHELPICCLGRLRRVSGSPLLIFGAGHAPLVLAFYAEQGQGRWRVRRQVQPRPLDLLDRRPCDPMAALPATRACPCRRSCVTDQVKL